MALHEGVTAQRAAAPSAASTRAFTGIDRDAAGEHPEFDPSIAAIIGPYAGHAEDYVRNDLKFRQRLALRSAHRPRAAVELRAL